MVSILVEQERLALTTISVFELYAGVVGKKRLAAIELLLKNVVILPLSDTAAREAAKIFTELKSKGKLIGNQDLLIAATSLIHELPLLTRNKAHFERVRGLHLFESDKLHN